MLLCKVFLYVTCYYSKCSFVLPLFPCFPVLFSSFSFMNLVFIDGSSPRVMTSCRPDLRLVCVCPVLLPPPSSSCVLAILNSLIFQFLNYFWGLSEIFRCWWLLSKNTFYFIFLFFEFSHTDSLPLYNGFVIAESTSFWSLKYYLESKKWVKSF